MKKWAVIIFLALPFALKSQIITTFAGGGSGGSGSLATVASIYDPIGGVFDKYGNYYFADGTGNIISKIANSGIYTIVAGNGSAGFFGDDSVATTAEVNEPTAVKIDANGNIYICDVGDSRIRKVDAISGIITTIAGNGTAGFGGDNGPATSAILNYPQDICFDKFGNLYIADCSNFRIRKIDTFGIIKTIAGIATSGYESGDNGPATAANISYTTGLAIDDTGNLYLAGSSFGGNVVRKINPTGIITTVAGVNGMYTYIGDGIAATDAPMSPIKIAIDNFGQLVIADNMNDRVFRVNLSGLIYTIAGKGVMGFSGDSGQATAAELNYPSGVTYDTCGNLYITDANNKRIRKVSFNPSCFPEKLPAITTNEVSMHPNPAVNELYVENVSSNAEYVLFNITGIIEQTGTLQAGNNQIDISKLPMGLYILMLTTADGQRVVRKVVKE